MAPREIYNVVKLVPKPGKFNEVVAAFNAFSQHIRDHEHGTHVYLALRPTDKDELILVEKYADGDSLKAHMATSQFKQFSRAVGPCLAQAPEIRSASFVGGLEGRSKL
ncbi:antibiotic biosynthesis monooxygenase [Aspergillus heteromorphus CBS 117.55]|uniref:Antibiotic biosynthesis monooxygenase n=1 Tax=Aspergillus heteromorphus CBS 117.55 TaxID=1448321 RepID=A0A317VVI8_9EURO|nr:antibiotic biosynthesis monooxygenase [Aspergillus heteromorphus CBS 117.55]PWY77371.1 antibiotic biosynthesis monooxygenase [Aspergillus heteromorphus CBS 117.55]